MVGGDRLDRRLTLKNGGSLGKRLDPQTDSGAFQREMMVCRYILIQNE